MTTEFIQYSPVNKFWIFLASLVPEAKFLSSVRLLVQCWGGARASCARQLLHLRATPQPSSIRVGTTDTAVLGIRLGLIVTNPQLLFQGAMTMVQPGF